MDIVALISNIVNSFATNVVAFTTVAFTNFSYNAFRAVELRSD